MSEPVDQLWRSIVEYSEVPTKKHLYIVGSFARSVTVYSQQVRAIGLVDAMAGLGHLRQSSRVAVIGGGIAGLTAAAALCKIGVRPVIFERESELAQLQRTSARRYLHPNIYDWPITSIDDVDAKLPVLNWQAKMASEVVKDLETQWKEVSANDMMILGAVESLRQVGNHWRIGFKTGADQTKDFDVVLSCVGFGIESGSYSYPYWADLPLDDAKIHSQSWLVSGAGDGALTDLMRLCIKNFLHDDALRVVVGAVEQTAGPEFMKELQRRVKARVNGPELFQGIDPLAIAAKLKLRDNAVTLIASEADLFGTAERPARSSVLNRLVLWVLLQATKVSSFSGRIPIDGITGTRGEYGVKIEGRDDPIECEDVLLRHGPDAPFGRSDNPRAPTWMDDRLSRPIKRLADKWKALYDSNQPDPTVYREHWDEQMLAHGRLSPDSREHIGLLIYSRAQVGKESQALTNTVGAAVRSETVRSALGNVPGSGKLGVLHLEDALSSARAFGRTIRALCDASIVIFDGTFERPSLMLLLGIRSVVRRGVTVVARKGELNADTWKEVAFNLRELRLVSVNKWSGLETEKQVRGAMEEGLKLQVRRPFRYADLPAFDGVRYLGAKSEDYEPRTRDAEVLVLCPFENEYSNNHWPEVQRALRDTWGNKSDPGPARRVIDLQSPELVGNRLYGSIRRDAECVADLTLNRPNVFFELGVRLVVNENGARVIRCTDLATDASAVEDADRLDFLLGTQSYKLGAANPQEEVARAIQTEMDKWSGGAVTRAYAFGIAQDSVEIRQEAGGHGIASLLWNAKEETMGQDVSQIKSSPSLYVDNPSIRSQARRYAFDAMLAFVLFTDSLPPGRRDSVRRAHALGEMDELFRDLELDDSERSRLAGLLGTLNGGAP